jgi:hypothetical protein
MITVEEVTRTWVPASRQPRDRKAPDRPLRARRYGAVAQVPKLPGGP